MVKYSQCINGYFAFYVPTASRLRRSRRGMTHDAPACAHGKMAATWLLHAKSAAGRSRPESTGLGPPDDSSRMGAQPEGANVLEQKPHKDKKEHDRSFLRAVSFFSQIGITMAACVLVGVLLGRYLDNLLGTAPWLLLLFSLLGAGAAIKALFDLGNKK